MGLFEPDLYFLQMARYEASDALEGRSCDLRPILEAFENYRAIAPRDVTEDCPECDWGQIPALMPADHIAFCPQHPALRRAAAAREAAVLVANPLAPNQELLECADLPLIDPELGYRPREHRYLSLSDCESALDALRWSDKHGPGSGKVAAALRLFIPLFDRVKAALEGLERCPWCDQVFPTKEAPAHLWSCPEHVAMDAAADLEGRLTARLGEPRATALLELVRRRYELREGLRRLSRVTERYDGTMGWDGEHAYSEAWSERPWRMAQARAAKLIARKAWEPDRLPDPAKRGGDSWGALARALVAARKGLPVSVEDAKVLRECRKRGDELIDSYGASTHCPACRRPGLYPGDVEMHLRSCHARPLWSEAKALRAELRVFAPERPEPLVAFGGDEVAPLDPRRGANLAFWRGRRSEALERLLAPAPKLQRDDEGLLAELVDSTRRFHGAGWGCHSCEKLVLEQDALVHQMWCGNQLEWAAIKELRATLRPLRGPLPTVVAELSRDCDRLVSEIARLLDACTHFWSSMGDGEGGKSTSSARNEAMLKRALRDSAAAPGA